MDGTVCSLQHFKDQNYYLNPHLSLGVGYQYTSYINLWFRGSYFETRCSSSTLQPSGVKGNNFEAALGVKHYLFPFREYDEYLRYFNYYGLLGVGALYINPKSATNWEPFSETMDFNQLALVVPVAIGVEYKLSSFFLMGLELGYNLTTTDYLDAAVRPASNSGGGRDHYASLGVNVIFRIPHGEYKYQDFLKFQKPE